MDSLVLGKSQIGKAVFAGRDFKKNDLIIEFTGKLFTYEELSEIGNGPVNYYVQIGKTLYMGPSGKLDDFINHSCDPSCGLKINGKEVILIAIKDIKKGSEITFDYSTTMDEDDWEIDCKCGSPKCRKRIRDFKYLSKVVQQKYISLGIVPKYVLKG